MKPYLEVVVSLKVLAGFQKTGVQLHWLWARIALHPKENVFLEVIRFDIRAVYYHVIKSDSPNFFNFCIRKDSVRNKIFN